MRNKNKKIFAGSMAAVLLLGASSLAWFTDRTEGSIEGQAGNLCLELSDIEANLDNLAPGDERDILFEYKNLGSLAMDTRVTYILSYADENGNPFGGDAELDEDPEPEDGPELEDGPEDDEGPQFGKVAQLDLGDEVIELTGDVSRARATVETGTLKGTQEDKGLDVLEENLKFHFDESVGNAGQKMTFKLDVIVEGKQNRNDAEWDEIHKTTVTFGKERLSVVPKSACNYDDDISAPKFSITVDDELLDEWNDFHKGNEEFKVSLTRQYEAEDSEVGDDEDGGVGGTVYLNEAAFTVTDISQLDITDIINEWMEEDDDFYGGGELLTIRIVNMDANSESDYIVLQGALGMRNFNRAYHDGEGHNAILDSGYGSIIYHEADIDIES